MFQTKVAEKIKTHILSFDKSFFFLNSDVYEIMWGEKYVAETDRPRMTIWRMRIACWIPKATNTHSEYVILTVFPLQQWLYERASMLRNTYIASLDKSGFSGSKKSQISLFKKKISLTDV
jgi:hypothetical protein